MKDRKFTQKNLIIFLAAFFFLNFIIPSTYAQESYALPGPVSLLTLTPDGKIGCEIHTGDESSIDHQNSLSGAGSPQSLQFGNNPKKSKSGGAQIFVDYYKSDPNFTYEQFVEAATAFQSAVDTWAANIDSDVPIYVAAVFQPLDEGVLGSAGPTLIYANNNGMERNSWYGNALADKLSKEDLSPESYDIIARFSTVFPNWYFGTDGNTPSSDYDFRTVVLHELCHGLGFFGSMTVDEATGEGSYGFGIPDPVYPAIYDRLQSSSDNKSILKDNRYPNFSTELGSALLSGALNAKGPNIKKATNGKGAEMFTVLDSDIFGTIPGLTDIWLPGSSYSHMDYYTYAGTKYGLMVPFISRGVSYAVPDDIVLGIFDDIGWNGKVNRQVTNGRLAVSEFDEIIYSGALNAYPNPVRDNFTLNLGEFNDRLISASLVDAIGKQVPLKYQAGLQKDVRFDLSQYSLQPGAYVLRLQFENTVVSNIRLIKN